MKIAAIIFLTLLVSIFGIGQDAGPRPISKGNMIFTCSMSITGYSGARYGNYNTLHFGSNLLYLLKKNFALGGALNYTITNTKENGWNNEIEIGPSFSYFLKNIISGSEIAGSIYPFVRLSILLSRWSKKDGNGDKASQLGLKIPVSAGFVFMMSKTVGMFSSIFYSLDSFKYDNLDEMVKGSRFGILFGFKLFKYKK